MAGIEPYSPCPCGSGQKFKWCCHKVEAFADKARRLSDGGQFDAAIKVLDEGLHKEKGNPWLLTRKAILQINQGLAEPAKETLRQVLQKNPKHFGALVLQTRLVLETEGPVNGAGMFQQVLTNVDREIWPELATLARVVALMLAQSRRMPAAFKHLDLIIDLGDPEQNIETTIRNLEASEAFSPWMKDRLKLAGPPSNLDPAARSRFEDAFGLGSSGLWASAAAAFDSLSANAPGGEADYNLGLCRLWLGDQTGAIAPLRRRSRQLGTSAEAVDLEILVQQVEPIHPDDRVEHVQLTWPLRNREALLASLRSKLDIFDDGPEALDPEDPNSPIVDHFILLDRPAIDKHSGKGLTPEDLPRILGRIEIGEDTVTLETHDDGRVDTLGDRFTAMATSAIAPAHPRTTVLSEVAKSSLALTWEWLYPDEMEQAEASRLDHEQQAKSLLEIWPITPMPYLGFRTPERASKDGNAEVPLRAALLQYEQARVLEMAGLDFAALRTRLNIPPEPAIDPASVDINGLPLGRFLFVKPEELDDNRLIRFYQRSRRAMLTDSLEAAARTIVSRPSLVESGTIDLLSVFSDLASMTASKGDLAKALTFLSQGRQLDPPSRKVANAPVWDMIEVRLKARTEPPEKWVPDLAIVLERYQSDSSANQVILMQLIEMGLVQMSPNPDDPSDVLIDSRVLHSFLTRFGPRVTTASGRLGVSAAKPEVWTPGGPSGGPTGGIWTPGSGAANPPSGDKPKLILPGR
jgi:tetratricopeptide (TPR) repeat protein